MEFNSVKWRNFLSYGNAWTELELNSNKSINIIGTNGHGKSVLLDVMHFILTGKPFRKVNVGQLINTTNKKKCVVELNLKHNNKYVKIIRGLSPKIFKIFIDKNPITKDTKSIDEDSKALDQQKWLETFLSINSKTLKYTLFISSTNYSPFLQMSAGDKRLFIEDILNIEIFSKILKSLKIDFNIVKENISNNEQIISKLESNIKIIDEMNEKQLLKDKETNDGQIEEEQKRIKRIKDDIEDTNLDIANTRSNIEKLKKEREEISKQITTIEKEVPENREKELELKKKKIELQDLYDEQIKKYNDSKNKGDKASWDNDKKLKENKTKKRFYDNHDVCPTCEHELSEEFKKEITKETKENIVRLEVIQEKQENSFKKLAEFKQKIDKLTEAIEKISNKHIDILDKLTKITNNINIQQEKSRSKSELIESKTDSITRSIESMEKLQENIKEIKEKIVELKKPKKKEKTELKDTVKFLEDLKINKSKTKDLQTEKQIYEFAFKLLADNGIKKYIIKRYVPLLNKYVNQYLDLFQAHYRLMFDENLDETIAVKGYESLSYNSLSAGERARCDLSLLFAFLSISKTKEHVMSNIIILDEVADANLDKDGIDGLIEIIEQLKMRGYTIFIISHREELMNVFDVTYRAYKKKFSKLEKV